MHPIWSFPYYSTFIVKQILGYAFFLVVCFIGVGIGVYVGDLEKLRDEDQRLIKRFMFICCKIGLKFCGYTLEDPRNLRVCYKKWLGPDWKPKWDGACTIVGNHVSFLESIVLIGSKLASFVGIKQLQKIPGVGLIYAVLRVIAVDRDSINSASSREIVKNMINKRQTEMSEGKVRNPLCIYPEGFTTNGEQLASFKKGAFASLKPVQPFFIEYCQVEGGTRPDQSNLLLSEFTSFYIMCCGKPGGVIKHTYLPIFEPNEYFWQQHWEPFKKEKNKVDVYMEVVRGLIL